jgi:hypothetical protein
MRAATFSPTDSCLPCVLKRMRVRWDCRACFVQPAADSDGFNLVYISVENEEVRRSISNLPTAGEAKAQAKAIALLPELMTVNPKGSPRMSTEGLEFLQQWIERNVSEEFKQSGDPESMTIQLAARAIYDASLTKYHNISSKS